MNVSRTEPYFSNVAYPNILGISQDYIDKFLAKLSLQNCMELQNFAE